MYPQGSFALGTVVRPYSKDKETNYDHDFICQVKGSRNSFTPSELWKEIQDVLSSSDLYGGKLVPCDECFTIEYADVNGIGFSIDIVPATDEDIAIKQELYNLCDNPELINTAITLPRYNQQKVYNWITNNPKGYRQWLENINEPFRLYNRDNYRKALFEANQSISLMMNHINSYLRQSLGGNSPYNATRFWNVPKDFFVLLGLEKIPSLEVNLTPSLLKKM